MCVFSYNFYDFIFIWCFVFFYSIPKPAKMDVLELEKLLVDCARIERTSDLNPLENMGTVADLQKRVQNLIRTLEITMPQGAKKQRCTELLKFQKNVEALSKRVDALAIELQKAAMTAKQTAQKEAVKKRSAEAGDGMPRWVKPCAYVAIAALALGALYYGLGYAAPPFGQSGGGIPSGASKNPNPTFTTRKGPKTGPTPTNPRSAPGNVQVPREEPKAQETPTKHPGVKSGSPDAKTGSHPKVPERVPNNVQSPREEPKAQEAPTKRPGVKPGSSGAKADEPQLSSDPGRSQNLPEPDADRTEFSTTSRSSLWEMMQQQLRSDRMKFAWESIQGISDDFFRGLGVIEGGVRYSAETIWESIPSANDISRLFSFSMQESITLRHLGLMPPKPVFSIISGFLPWESIQGISDAFFRGLDVFEGGVRYSAETIWRNTPSENESIQGISDAFFRGLDVIEGGVRYSAETIWRNTPSENEMKSVFSSPRFLVGLGLLFLTGVFGWKAHQVYRERELAALVTVLGVPERGRNEAIATLRRVPGIHRKTVAEQALRLNIPVERRIDALRTLAQMPPSQVRQFVNQANARNVCPSVRASALSALVAQERENLNHRGAHLIVDGQELQSHPANVLFLWTKHFNDYVGFPRIRFMTAGAVDMDGIDAGGITRDFVTRLFLALHREDLVDEQKLPVLRVDQTVIPKISQNQEFDMLRQVTCYESIGRMFAHALQRSESIKIGEIYHPVLFEMLHALTALEIDQINLQQLNLDMIPQQIRNKLLKIYLKARFPETFQQFDPIFQQNVFSQTVLDDFVDRGVLPQYLTMAGMTRDEFYEGYELNHILLAVFVIAKSMKLHLHWSDWNRAKGATPAALSEAIQGSLSPDLVVNALPAHFAGEADVMGFLRRWIRDPATTRNQLRNFVWAVTGSTTLSPRQQLLVNLHGNIQALPAYHTCSCQIDLPIYATYETFQRKLEQSLEHVVAGGAGGLR